MKPFWWWSNRFFSARIKAFWGLSRALCRGSYSTSRQVLSCCSGSIPKAPPFSFQVLHLQASGEGIPGSYTPPTSKTMSHCSRFSGTRVRTIFASLYSGRSCSMQHPSTSSPVGKAFSLQVLMLAQHHFDHIILWWPQKSLLTLLVDACFR